MDNKDLKKKLKKLKPVLEKNYKVKNIGIFGSFAKNEANEDSDVDILVQFSEDIGWEFVDLKQFLEENLEREVDLVTVEALKPELKEEILRDVIYQ
ncbi:MAG: nucleotidyltransferase family protein [Halanaerobium sp.]